MYRAVIYAVMEGQELIIRKTDWRATLEDCFIGMSYDMSDSMRYYRRIEYKTGSVQYYFQLLDDEGCVVKRSENYQDADNCLKNAELERDQSGFKYSLDRIFVPHILYSLAI